MSRRKQEELTRADRVRMRKSEQKTPQTGRAVRHYAAEAAPLVITRGGYGTPVIQRTRNKPRRKFSIPLDQRGTEMQLPALPILHPGWRILSVLLMVACSALIYLAYTSPALRVGHAQVKGLQYIPAGDLLRAVDIVDRPIFTLDPRQLAAELSEAFPELKDTTVELLPPASVMINTTEIRPVMIWQLEFRSVWADETGRIIPQRGEIEGIPSVEVEGHLPLRKLENGLEAELKDGETERSASAAAEPQFVDLALQKSALLLGERAPAGAILTFNMQEGLGWYDPKGWRVYFGTQMENLDQKLIVYEAVAAHLGKEGIRPSMISVEHVHAPFYRTEH